MAKVLVVEDSRPQAKHLEGLLVAAGHHVDLAANGAEALAAIAQNIPDVVLTDMQMPEMNGLELVAAVRSACPALPVVMATGDGNEELAVQALRAGAASYLPRRNLDRDILELLTEILSVTASRKKRELFLGRMTSVEHRFVLENDTELVSEVVSHVEELMQQMRLFDESAQMRVGIAVHEAVVNAMVHGNLEVGSELKGGDWKGYHELVAARAVEPKFRHRRVVVAVRAARGPFLQVRVRDEGPGYDPSKLPDPTDPANIGAASGRGLLLIRTFFDKVTHNASGNEITMTKGEGVT